MLAHKALFTGEVKFLTYSPELDVSTHFELHRSAHYVHAFVSTNDGFAVPFNVQVSCSTTCDLQWQKTLVKKCALYHIFHSTRSTVQAVRHFIHTLSVEAFFTLSTLTPLGK